MDIFINYLKTIILGIVEGITEWLPVSSTGHMILTNAFMNTQDTFLNSDVYLYVIQLGAILAVVTLFFKKLNPFSPSKNDDERKATWIMWLKIAVGCIPAGVFGLLFDDYMDKISIPYVVAAMLIIYGIAFLFVEAKERTAKITDISQLTYETALFIGLFQALSIVPGTSRSGATIIGALILGCSRSVSAEYTFFMAIPIMAGVSLLKILKHGLDMTGQEWGLLIAGFAVAYLVSLVCVKLLMDFVKKHSFKAFGYYRIALGLIVIILCLCSVISGTKVC